MSVDLPEPEGPHSTIFSPARTVKFGDHHMHGMEGVRFYTKLKTITSKRPVRDPSSRPL